MVATKINEKDLAFYSRLVADHSTDSIVVTDTDGLFVWANKAFRRLTGYTLDEVRGQKPGAVLQGPDTDPSTINTISSALKERGPVRAEIYNYSKAGDGYWIELSITPIFDKSGKHTHFMAIERDISERRALEQRNENILKSEEHRQSERRLLAQTSEWLYSAKSLEELMQSSSARSPQ